MHKILQFGEGNFLRAFIEPMIEAMNRDGFGASVYAVKPRPGEPNPAFEAQQCRYSILVRGIADGNTVERLEEITCLKKVFSSDREWPEIEDLILDPKCRWIVSNTTEAGIEYVPGNCDTFPGKVARLLALRAHAGMKGISILPCELVENNGALLREYVLKYLEGDKCAEDYVALECRFYNTLVDRIVAGFPPDADKYAPEDKLLTAAEPFTFMAVESSEPLPFPREFVTCAPDITPYRTRKVRCLNASHTAMVCGALLSGFTEVAEVLEDKAFRSRVESTLFNEILPTVDQDDAEKKAYAQAVLERFANPFAHHKLASISLNSVAKWKVRVLPVILDYRKLTGKLPEFLV
ncbi:MAG: hypothetical protein J6S21_05260, partial [Victivallales bacterium]|nr:hypothetical protein [Victivallales bacterium]